MAPKKVDLKNSPSKSFYSKLLLFGEYSVIKDSWALSTPYSVFKGSLSFPHGSEHGSVLVQELKSFAQYLKKVLSKGEDLPFEFDLSSFEFDLSQELYFDSTIPVGFGVGSSGALCAAIFHRYGSLKNQTESHDLELLKKVFSILEAHFHGASSGMDPLVSYVDSPILMKEQKRLELVSIPECTPGEGAIFLLNTGRPRRTEPLVNLFLEKCSNKSFNQLCDQTLLPLTNNCIQAFLQCHIHELAGNFKELSLFQYTHLTPMIPKLYQELWQSGLEKDQYYLKLCGAGGGGFLLGFTRDFRSVCQVLNGHNIRAVYQF